MVKTNYITLEVIHQFLNQDVFNEKKSLAVLLSNMFYNLIPGLFLCRCHSIYTSKAEGTTDYITSFRHQVLEFP